ncbi:MAG: hypothetical protein ACRCX2_31670, partial [Paraclostridium sp.]
MEMIYMIINLAVIALLGILSIILKTNKPVPGFDKNIEVQKLSLGKEYDLANHLSPLIMTANRCYEREMRDFRLSKEKNGNTEFYIGEAEAQKIVDKCVTKAIDLVSPENKYTLSRYFTAQGIVYHIASHIQDRMMEDAVAMNNTVYNPVARKQLRNASVKDYIKQ